MSAVKKVDANFVIELPTWHEAENIFQAIGPELDDSPSERAKVDITFQENYLILAIKAQDTPSLRAAMNSYLRWIMLSKKVLELDK